MTPLSWRPSDAFALPVSAGREDPETSPVSRSSSAFSLVQGAGAGIEEKTELLSVNNK